MLRPSMMILLTWGNARETVPLFPLALPVVIRTVSPFLIFILARWGGFFSFSLIAILSLLRLSLSYSRNDKLQRRTTNNMSALTGLIDQAPTTGARPAGRDISRSSSGRKPYTTS